MASKRVTTLLVRGQALEYMQNGIWSRLFLAHYPDCNFSTATLIIQTHTHPDKVPAETERELRTEA